MGGISLLTGYYNHRQALGDKSPFQTYRLYAVRRLGPSAVHSRESAVVSTAGAVDTTARPVPSTCQLPPFFHHGHTGPPALPILLIFKKKKNNVHTAESGSIISMLPDQWLELLSHCMRNSEEIQKSFLTTSE